MSEERKRKYEQLYEEEVADTTYSKRSFSKKAIPFMLTHASKSGFLVGLLLFVFGIVGEFMGLEGYSYYGKSRGVHEGVHYQPYYFNCVYGIAFMLLCYKNCFCKNK